jgi:sugar phosphate isomerase/epimerase
VNSPYLRALPDFCNSMLIQNDQQYNDRALAALFPHAFNISHVKDMEIDNGKVLRVDVDRIFAIAKKAGYRGYFSMEWEGTGDPYEGTRRLLQQSAKDLA